MLLVEGISGSAHVTVSANETHLVVLRGTYQDQTGMTVMQTNQGLLNSCTSFIAPSYNILKNNGAGMIIIKIVHFSCVQPTGVQSSAFHMVTLRITRTNS